MVVDVEKFPLQQLILFCMLRFDEKPQNHAINPFRSHYNGKYLVLRARKNEVKQL
jgi:hypothetical protein